MMQNMMELAMVKSELWYELIETIEDQFRNYTLEDLVFQNIYPSQKIQWLHNIIALELEQEFPWVSQANLSNQLSSLG
jgi:hypothetical protein